MAVVIRQTANFLFYLADVNHNSGTFYRGKRLEICLHFQREDQLGNIAAIARSDNGTVTPP
ncbi:hypothetical protein IQ259_04185 [Fortiea sp. LEGE XX443]|uniref:hypothetical protein n=1 Tax=Fortiea sp. LEGE XX443 TaxID=1828611 RepID=UPI0018800ECE|nr:hypothetical protein [Fortiea sp. LEGE XX443]MBE9004245.1 hypothetical protein [Fortiea sp. LEGE XX443]